MTATSVTSATHSSSASTTASATYSVYPPATALYPTAATVYRPTNYPTVSLYPLFPNTIPSIVASAASAHPAAVSSSAQPHDSLEQIRSLYIHEIQKIYMQAREEMQTFPAGTALYEKAYKLVLKTFQSFAMVVQFQHTPLSKAFLGVYRELILFNEAHQGLKASDSPECAKRFETLMDETRQARKKFEASAEGIQAHRFATEALVMQALQIRSEEIEIGKQSRLDYVTKIMISHFKTIASLPENDAQIPSLMELAEKAEWIRMHLLHFDNSLWSGFVSPNWTEVCLLQRKIVYLTELAKTNVNKRSDLDAECEAIQTQITTLIDQSVTSEIEKIVSQQTIDGAKRKIQCWYTKMRKDQRDQAVKAAADIPTASASVQDKKKDK